MAFFICKGGINLERKAWEKDLPRKQYEQFVKVEQSQSWFEVYDIGYDVYAIYEPFHFQEVISFLIKGNDAALLFDTGAGIGSMKKLVDELWDKELIVVNSHGHFDHIEGNYEFEMVNILDHPNTIMCLEQGLDAAAYAKEYAPETFSIYSPVQSIEMVHHRCNYQTFEVGHLFYLGNRHLKVILTPGHTKDSIMLVDETYRLLFTGDTLYPATLYSFGEEAIDIYANTMKKLASEYRNYTLVCSHNEPLRSGVMLEKAAKAFAEIIDENVEAKVTPEGKVYEFNDFNIWLK